MVLLNSSFGSIQCWLWLVKTSIFSLTCLVLSDGCLNIRPPLIGEFPVSCLITLLCLRECPQKLLQYISTVASPSLKPPIHWLGFKKHPFQVIWMVLVLTGRSWGLSEVFSSTKLPGISYAVNGGELWGSLLRRLRRGSALRLSDFVFNSLMACDRTPWEVGYLENHRKTIGNWSLNRIQWWTYHLVNVYTTMEKFTILNGKTQYKWI